MRSFIARHQTPVLLAALLVLIAAVTLLSRNEALQVTLTEMFIRVVVVVGLYVFIGNSGIISFGQIGFIGLAAALLGRNTAVGAGFAALLFGALISTYFLCRGRSVVPPYPKDIYNIPYTSVSSFVLLMSSLTMVLALAAIQRGDHAKLRAWLMATALLGMTFIAGQVYEFTRFVEEGLTLKTNLFGSTLLVLTGFHGAHVFGGVIMLSVVLYRGMAGQFDARHYDAVEAASLYWHFVDVVWILLFSLLYLLPGKTAAT